MVRALQWLESCTWEARAQERDVPADLADALAAYLFAEELPRNAWLDVGLWGPFVYRDTALTAIRLHDVATTGDELCAA